MFYNSSLNFDDCRILAKLSSFLRLNMLYEGNNFMNVYNLRFLSSVRTHSYFTNGLCLKYLIRKNIQIWMLAYRKQRVFFNIAKSRADWAKWWWFLDSPYSNYPKNVAVYPAAKHIFFTGFKLLIPKIEPDYLYNWQFYDITSTKKILSAA